MTPVSNLPSPSLPPSAPNPPWYKQRWFNHLLASLAGSALLGAATVLCPLIPNTVVAKVCSVVLTNAAPLAQNAANEKGNSDLVEQFSVCKTFCDGGSPTLENGACKCQ